MRATESMLRYRNVTADEEIGRGSSARDATRDRVGLRWCHAAREQSCGRVLRGRDACMT